MGSARTVVIVCATVLGFLMYGGGPTSAAAGPADGIVVINPVAALHVAGEFNPSPATSEADGDVTFVSAAANPHHPVDDEGDCFDAGTLLTGDTALVNVAACGEPGDVIAYHCAIHPTSTASIVIA